MSRIEVDERGVLVSALGLDPPIDTESGELKTPFQQELLLVLVGAMEEGAVLRSWERQFLSDLSSPEESTGTITSPEPPIDRK